MDLLSHSVVHLGFHLPDRARFRVTGADSLRYLNGQLTQDLKRVTERLALPACITSAKGRLQAEVWVLADGRSPSQMALLLDAPGELREQLLARLERYIVADDVGIEDVSGTAELFHFPGSEMPEVAGRFGVVCAQASRLGMGGWDLWVPTAETASFCEAMGERLGGIRDYERLRIEQGIPAWGTELTEETLPPEAGLDKTHIDYHKGCYIGQEVISRLKSVGHVNQTLRRFKGRAGDGPIKPGHTAHEGPLAKELLYMPGIRETSVGRLTSVFFGADGEISALGYLKRGVDGEEFETASGATLAAVPEPVVR
jgi:folate-binding protein YgfZ